MKFQHLIIGLLICFFEVANAVEVPFQGRIFVGGQKMKPKELNTELTSQSLKNIDTVPVVGAEALYPLGSFLDVGLKYTKRYIEREESPDAPLTPYKATLDQDSVAAVVRLPFIKTTLLRADVFGGFGGTNTTFKIKSSGQDGSLTKKDPNDWFAGTYSVYGGSVALGFKKFFIYAESGVETNKVDSFTRVGTVNNNVATIDLSGSYLVVGIIIDGMTKGKK